MTQLPRTDLTWLYGLEKKMTLAQLWKNPEWIAKGLRKGRFNPAVIRLLPEIVVLLEECYPGNWDISIIPSVIEKSTLKKNKYGGQFYNVQTRIWRIELSPVVKIPDGIIKNSKGLQIPMKELFIRIPLESLSERDVIARTRINFNSLQGTRSKISIEEAKSGYIHSHLTGIIPSGTANMKFSNFCLGHGEVMQVFSMLNSNWSPELFKMLLFLLQTIAYWESLEGTPYKYISKILGEVANSLTNKEAIDWANHIIITNIKKVKERTREPITLRWINRNGRYSIVSDETFEEYLKFEGNRAGYYGPNVLISYDDEGNCCSVTRQTSTTNISIGNDFLAFRGEQIRLIIDGNLRELSTEFYVNPKIKNYVKQQLEYKANSEASRHFSTRWLSESHNA